MYDGNGRSLLEPNPVVEKVLHLCVQSGSSPGNMTEIQFDSYPAGFCCHVSAEACGNVDPTCAAVWDKIAEKGKKAEMFTT